MVSRSPATTRCLAGCLAGMDLTGCVIRLFGELGSGKTEFVRGFTAALDGAVQVQSPSFTLVNTYPTTPPVYHADLYRIRNAEEYEDLDIESEASVGVLIVEWAERAGSLLDHAKVDITITYDADLDRRIIVHTPDPHLETAIRGCFREAAQEEDSL